MQSSPSAADIRAVVDQALLDALRYFNSLSGPSANSDSSPVRKTNNIVDGRAERTTNARI
jgi:hypothetical protein